MKIVKLTWFPVLFILLYSGYLIWRRNQPVERPQVFTAPIHDPYGNDLKIMGFYAEQGALARGQSTLLCYGVVNATTVKLDPPVDSVWPSLNRCLEIKPTKTTRYTLTAEDGKQHTVTQSVDVVVK